MKDKELNGLIKFKKKSGWSYDRISKELGIHSQTVVGWFSGKNKPGNLTRNLIREFLEKKEGRSI
ncbi:MAG: hypothetical protein PHX45_00110 [Acidobacteriota bacterium]|nr:hypothetical protein [Acidobacteriota bacterium]